MQDPQTALYPSMPVHATRDIDIDYVVELSHMPALLARLAETERPRPPEVREAMTPTPTNIAYPECTGPLQEEPQGIVVEFPCRVRHIFTRLAIVQDHDAALERSIWAAIVALEEGAEISKNLSRTRTATGKPNSRASKLTA